MVMIPNMTKLVSHDVLKQIHRCHHDSPVKPNNRPRTGASPTGFHLADFDAFHSNPQTSSIAIYNLLNLHRSTFTIPLQQRLADDTATIRGTRPSRYRNNETAAKQACRAGSGNGRPTLYFQLVLTTEIPEGFAADIILLRMPSIAAQPFVLADDPFGLILNFLRDERSANPFGSSDSNRRIGVNSDRDRLTTVRTSNRILDFGSTEDH